MNPTPRYFVFMPNYRRAVQPGGTFFLTVITNQRHAFLMDDAAKCCLHDAIRLTRDERPFDLRAMALLPDHWHIILTLPDGDSDFSGRIAAIKGRFSRTYPAAGGKPLAQSASRVRQGYAGFWQKRFWEHVVRDEDDFIHCVEYVHYNPVKHRYVNCPHAWRETTFHRYVREERYPSNWYCACDGREQSSPPRDIPGAEMDE